MAGRLVPVTSADREPSVARKGRGGYYTDPAAAAALIRWAVRSPHDRVLDPSFGAGVFLVEAAARLTELGGDATGVHGVEVDRAAHAAGGEVARGSHVPAGQLLRRDFFALDPEPGFHAVVGNPPFVRFQRFKGTSRSRAADRAAVAGVALSPLASAWAPFVIHATAFVRRGGRLAMLVPHEITQAAYAADVLAFLAGAFGEVTVVAFRERIFPRLDQDVVALLASARGERSSALRVVRADGVEDLAAAAARAAPVSLAALDGVGRSLRSHELSRAARDAYERLEAHPAVVRLAELATVTSGYVTGANAFFHLSPFAADEAGIERDVRTRAVFRSRALGGLRFDHSAWERATVDASAGWLFTPPPTPAGAAKAYVERGEARGVHHGYKTRNRAVWHQVPRVQAPDLVLPAMAADTHALAVNSAGAAPANTLHAVVLRQDRLADGADVERLAAGGGRAPDTYRAAPGARAAGTSEANAERAHAMAVAWQTTLSRLSRELQGRVLGGGMLKLEPGGAGRVLLPGALGLRGPALDDLFATVDAHLRAGRPVDARRAADVHLVEGALGASTEDLAALREAVRLLQELRRRRRTDGSTGSAARDREDEPTGESTDSSNRH